MHKELQEFFNVYRGEINGAREERDKKEQDQSNLREKGRIETSVLTRNERRITIKK